MRRQCHPEIRPPDAGAEPNETTVGGGVITLAPDRQSARARAAGRERQEPCQFVQVVFLLHHHFQDSQLLARAPFDQRNGMEDREAANPATAIQQDRVTEAQFSGEPDLARVVLPVDTRPRQRRTGGDQVFARRGRKSR
jgi:hypothetical protein